MRFSLFIILICLRLFANAQKEARADDFIKELLESIAEDLPEDFDLMELTEKLIYLQKHPINLNRTNPDELSTLFFLSPLQIGSLLSHIAANGHLIDLLELQSISNFDLLTIERILPFVEVKTSSNEEAITIQALHALGNHDLLIRLGRIIQNQKGFKDLPGSKYLGSAEKLMLRYKYNLSNRISFSAVLEKDAGEKLNVGIKNLFSDFHSGHLAISQVGRFKKIVLGDYSLQFGQGLTLWSGFGFGKAADVTSLVKNGTGLKPYTSANEYSFLRGLATTIQLSKRIDFINFISYRSLDASLSINEVGEDVLSTINETGLHRTATEIKNQNAIKQLMYGGSLRYQHQQLNIDAIIHHTGFDHVFVNGSPSYKLYDFTGTALTNFGISYSYVLKNCYLFGEVASDNHWNIATVNGMLISLSSKLSCAIQYRNYNKQFHNFFSQGIAEGGNSSNEKGLYVGLNMNPNKKWIVSFYSDKFSFPWLKFRIDAPSFGQELLAQIAYVPTKKFKASARYKIENKQQNTDVDLPIQYLDEVRKTSYRIDVQWPGGKNFSFQNRFEISKYKKGISALEGGFLYYQDVKYSPSNSKFAGNIRLAFFHTPSYNTRIYAYEDDVLYNFSFGIYNGSGWRSYLNLKYKIAKKLDLWVRHGMFLYRDTTTVGSGLDEIQGNKKAEIKLQFRYQF